MKNKNCGHPDGTECQCKVPETRAATPEMEEALEEKLMVLQGLQIELRADGGVSREFYGEAQNLVLQMGLIHILKMEIEVRQKGKPGFTPSPELVAGERISAILINMSNVLIQMQGLLASVNGMIQELGEEDKVDAGDDS